MAVPAVHHQTAFAKQIHCICSDPKHRPDAIAVELGHSVVVELVKYLYELRQGSSKKVILPCMLGLMKQNQYIHVEMAEKALFLQEFYRVPLSRLPEEILAERLSFSKWSTLFISPADSIIEAVRCAIELDIPVYGVDLNDFAHAKTERYSIEDPQKAHANMMVYGNRVMKYCDSGRDPRIDFNRETFMAAGLKYCLTKHRKILFTCGMAHWKSIVSLLNDDKLNPYPVHELSKENDFRRVIVHPSLAASVMEIVPQVTFDYEKNRFPVVVTQKEYQRTEPENRIRNCLDEVYNEYTSSIKSGELNRSDSIDWSNIGNYEQYLFQLSAIKQRAIPEFASILASAEVMMNEKFCRLLTRKIMEVNPDWASSKDFPDLPVMEPAANSLNDFDGKSFNRRVRLTTGARNNASGDTEFYTTIHSLNETDVPDISKYWTWVHQKKDKHSEPRFGNPWLWPPGESLIYGLGFKAAEISSLNHKLFKYSSAFDGSLEGGIDVKATIRSIIRGEHKFYVTKLTSGLEQAIIDGINPDPFVIIFPESPDVFSGKWNFFTAGSALEEFVKDQELFKKITNERGRAFISSVSIDLKIPPPEHLKPLGAEMTRTHGTVMFGNPCINVRQSACWLESTNYKCCPIVFDFSMDSLLKMYDQDYHLKLNLTEWQESLIRMAIPFSKKMVTIIAPDTFQPSLQTRIEAGRKKVTLNVVGYSNFSQSKLDEARHRISLPTLDRSGIHFPPEAEYLIGQTKETYLEMLPPAMRKQVGYNEV